MPTLPSIEDFATAARESGYSLGAFLFVQRGLEFTVCRTHGEVDEDNIDLAMHPSRHITAHQLCYGLRDLAIQDYGLLARTVLRSWNIHSCEDFGRVVFAMVNAGLMNKSDGDAIDDFDNIYRFSDAFSPELLAIEA